MVEHLYWNEVKVYDRPRKLVFASDYAALAAELAGYKDSHEKYCPAVARIAEFEAALDWTLAQLVAKCGGITELMPPAALADLLEASKRRCCGLTAETPAQPTVTAGDNDPRDRLIDLDGEIKGAAKP